MGVKNAGQESFAEIFPGIANPQSTGAGEGSAGVSAARDTGTALSTVIVTVPGASSQPPQPQVTVLSSDVETPSQSDEYFKREPISGVSLAGGTGAGHGTVLAPPHPYGYRP